MVRRLGAHALFLAMLAAAAAFTFAYLPTPSGGLDGAYYFNIARHVAHRDGLVTSISLYHHGMTTLPAASNVYPLWPLTLGWAGRIVDVGLAAAVLPKLLYLVCLTLTYVLADRACRRLDLFAIPHVAVLFLAVHPPFVYATSLPYTEGLGFGLTLGTLLLVDVSTTARSARLSLIAAAGAGLLAGLAYATRFQNIVVPVAVLFVAWRRPHRWRVVFLAIGTAAIPILAVAAHLARLPGFNLGILIDSASYRESSAYPPLDYMFHTDGVLAWLRDRAHGLSVAFDPTDAESYCAGFGVAALAVLPAAALLLVTRLRRRALATLAEPQHVVITAALVTGLALLAPLHLIHGVQWHSWLFGWRNGVPFVFILVTALGGVTALVRRPALRLATSLAILVLAAVSLIPVARRAAGMRGPRQPSPGQVAIAAWLDARPEPPTVLAVEPQPLAALSSARFHWTACWDDPSYLEILLPRIHLDYVILRREQADCPSLAALRDKVELTQVIGGYGVLRFTRP